MFPLPKESARWLNHTKKMFLPRMLKREFGEPPAQSPSDSSLEPYRETEVLGLHEMNKDWLSLSLNPSSNKWLNAYSVIRLTSIFWTLEMCQGDCFANQISE